MLTKNDLDQIGNILDKKLDEKLDSKLEAKLKPIKKDLRYLKKTVDILVERTDREETNLGKRVTRVEKHLGL